VLWTNGALANRRHVTGVKDRDSGNQSKLAKAQRRKQSLDSLTRGLLLLETPDRGNVPCANV